MSVVAGDASEYLRSHGIAADVADAAGVGVEDGALVFPYETPDGDRFERRRRLAGGPAKVLQPQGKPLCLWWPAGRPEAGSPVLVAEGEPDALAALSAQAAAAGSEDSGLRFFGSVAVAAVPGVGYPAERLAADLRQVGVREAWIACDGDDAGRRYTDAARTALEAVGIRAIPVPLPDGADVADVLAAAEDRGEALANLLADAEAVAAEWRSEPSTDGQETAPVEFTTLTAREFCALPEPPESRELLGSFLRRGQRTVIGAQTGEGKTTLAYAMAAAVALERELLGATGAGGRALILDAEQGEGTIKRSLREAGLDACDLIDVLRVPDGLRLDREPSEVAALDAVLAGGRFALVVADPLYKLHGGDSNAEREAVDLMRQFDAWRERYGFALLLLTHCRKLPVGAKFTLNELFGSGAFQRGAEVVLGLRRLSPGYARLHFFKDRDGDMPVNESWGLLFDRERGFRRDPNDGKQPTAAERVREALEQRPDMTEQQLREMTGYAERTVRGALKQIGALSSTGPHGLKAWSLPPEAAA